MGGVADESVGVVFEVVVGGGELCLSVIYLLASHSRIPLSHAPNRCVVSLNYSYLSTKVSPFSYRNQNQNE